MNHKTLVVAICGASGSIYGIRLLKELLIQPVHVYLLISNSGRLVLQHETDCQGDDMAAFLQARGISFHEAAKLSIYDENDFLAPPASGSFRHDGMVIAPCSMATLAHIAGGLADNLVHRAADVCLKEKRPLIVLPRETPLNRIHLCNMLKAAEAGCTILPPCPSFYNHPETINDLVDTVIARVLDHLGLPQTLQLQWGLH
jgi:4-hydroxy-3-polyprenylbenzoate decarboxylase